MISVVGIELRVSFIDALHFPVMLFLNRIKHAEMSSLACKTPFLQKRSTWEIMLQT